MNNIKYLRIKTYIHERIEHLDEELENVRKLCGTKCIGYAYGDGAREELLSLLKEIEVIDNE